MHDAWERWWSASIASFPKMKELSAELYGQFAKAKKLEATIKTNLGFLGFGE